MIGRSAESSVSNAVSVLFLFSYKKVCNPTGRRTIGLQSFVHPKIQCKESSPGV